MNLTDFPTLSQLYETLGESDRSKCDEALAPEFEYLNQIGRNKSSRWLEALLFFKVFDAIDSKPWLEER